MDISINKFLIIFLFPGHPVYTAKNGVFRPFGMNFLWCIDIHAIYCHGYIVVSTFLRLVVEILHLINMPDKRLKLERSTVLHGLHLFGQFQYRTLSKR